MKFLSFLLAGCASLAAACTPPPQAASPDPAPIAVSLAHAAVTDVSTPFEAGGVVRARTTALIASRVMAPIVSIDVRPGDRVRRGQRLATLDPRDMQATKTQAAAAAVAADESARAAEADLRAADAAVTLARATHDRVSGLHAKRSATAQELDQAVAALAGAEAQRTAAAARVAASASGRDAAHASAHVAAIAASYAELTAPFDGVIVERRADPGSIATPGMPLLTLEDPAAYRLEVQVDEARVAFVARGQTVDVRLDGAEEEGLPSGRVVEIARVDPASHTFLVKVDLGSGPEPGPRFDLRSGRFGRVLLPGATRRAVTIPAAAILKRGQLTFVYLVDGDNRAHLRPISTMPADRGRVEALAGLRDRDAVVVNPPVTLTDGMRVSGAGK